MLQVLLPQATIPIWTSWTVPVPLLRHGSLPYLALAVIGFSASSSFLESEVQVAGIFVTGAGTLLQPQLELASASVPVPGSQRTAEHGRLHHAKSSALAPLQTASAAF